MDGVIFYGLQSKTKLEILELYVHALKVQSLNAMLKLKRFFKISTKRKEVYLNFFGPSLPKPQWTKNGKIILQ